MAKLLHQLVDHALSGGLRRRVFFLHVPKCGGLSLFDGLRACRGLPGLLRPKSAVYLDAEASERAAEVMGVPARRLQIHLSAYWTASSRVEVLGGHIRFSEAVWEASRTDWGFVTLLRDPVARWYSSYYFNRHHPNPAHRTRVDGSLEDYLETAAARYDGELYTRWFADRPRAGDSIEGMQEAALANLRRIDLVGRLEDLPGFQRQFRERFGAALRLRRSNASPAGREARQPLSEAVQERVRALCAPDLALMRELFGGEDRGWPASAR